MSAAVAVGVFDGLHLGHAAILERALARARERASRCVVVSFDPHPDYVLGKRPPAPPLTPPDEKRARLLALGVDDLAILPFTSELAALEPEAFVERHLVAPFDPHALVVGEDFALGYRRRGDVPRLREIGARMGFRVDAVPLLERDGAAVTTTRIRGLLDQGEVAAAARLLGRRYGIRGRVVPGAAIGRTLGFPTANLEPPEPKAIPADGIYAVWARVGADPTLMPGAMSIGVRPTFEGRDRALEVHLIGWSGDLAGREVAVEFVEWLRAERRFESPTALARAIGADVEEARRRLGSAAATPRS